MLLNFTKKKLTTGFERINSYPDAAAAHEFFLQGR